MSKTEYKEDWSKHNFACTEVKRECALPSEFDSAIFDAEQRQIIAEYLSDYRTEVIKIILDFITNVEANGNARKNKDALFVRIASRAVILDGLLNNRNTKVLELKTLYGISTHQYYDEINRLTVELEKHNKNISTLLKRK